MAEADTFHNHIDCMPHKGTAKSYYMKGLLKLPQQEVDGWPSLEGSTR